jgi:hypothetical protein
MQKVGIRNLKKVVCTLVGWSFEERVFDHEIGTHVLPSAPILLPSRAELYSFTCLEAGPLLL